MLSLVWRSGPTASQRDQEASLPTSPRSRPHQPTLHRPEPSPGQRGWWEGLRGHCGGLCSHFVPEEGGVCPRPQPANTLKPLKPRLQHLPQGSHPRPRAASAPFVYGSDVRGWSLGAQPRASPLPAAPAPHASPLGNRIASVGLPSAMPPAGVARRTHSWVFLEGSVAQKQRKAGRRRRHPFRKLPRPSASVRSYALQFPACYLVSPGRSQGVAIATIPGLFPVRCLNLAR